VIGLAFVAPLFFSRSKYIPVVVGEILAGLILGKSGFNIIHPNIELDFMAEIGFAFLMFLSGLEIDFSIMGLNKGNKMTDQGIKKISPVMLGVLSFLVTIIFAFLLGLLFTRLELISDPWIMALILSTTSLGIVVPVLKEKKIISHQYGQSILIASLLADFVTMILITVYASIYGRGGLSYEILLIFILFLAFAIFVRLGLKGAQNDQIQRKMSDLEENSPQIWVRGALALMLGFVVLAEFLGAELILGAFLAGAIIAILLPHHEEGMLVEKLEAIGYGIFIPIFFIMVGVKFNLPMLLQNPKALLLTPILLVAAFLVKIIGTLIFKNQYSWKETIASGFLLSSRLSLIIAASAIGLSLGVINEETNSAIILVATLTSIISPMIFSKMIGDYDTSSIKSFVIHGVTQFGQQVAQELKSHGELVTFIESDSVQAKNLDPAFTVFEHCEVETLDFEEKKKTEAILFLYDEDETNYNLAIRAKKNGFDRVLAIVNKPANIKQFEEQEITPILFSAIQPSFVTLLARNPSTLNLLINSEDHRDVVEVNLSNQKLFGKRVRDIYLPEDVLLLSIRRNQEIIVPHGTTLLNRGDRITLIGDTDILQDYKKMFIS
jgi:Kef-type K+ transport system membrane component KefB/Trk K+ transport system NAD-binding subunit